jgi:hypothetical protein
MCGHTVLMNLVLINNPHLMELIFDLTGFICKFNTVVIEMTADVYTFLCQLLLTCSSDVCGVSVTY